MRLVARRNPPTLSGPYVRTVTDWAVKGRDSTGRLYALNLTTFTLGTSDDNGLTWTARTGNVFGVFGSTPTQIALDATHMWATIDDGKVWRSPINNFTGWVNVTPPAMPGDNIGMPHNLCVTPTSVLVGSYNASTPGRLYVFRWDGTSWTTTLDNPNARHVHSVQRAPSGDIYASTGDAGTAATGLWRSIDDGVSWTQVASGRYGIALAFPPTPAGIPPRLIAEADGPISSLLYQYRFGAAAYDSLIEAPDVADGGGSWAGSGRGITVLPSGDLWFISDGEGGAIGPRVGMWMSPAPHYKSLVLLEELTASPGAHAGYVAGPFLWFRNWRMTLPTFT